MPIYDYVCGACGTRTEVVHGIHDNGPAFCPACGVKGKMKKAFAPPTIVFKGSGWAKKDRASTSTSGRASKASTPSSDVGTATSTGSSSTSGSAADTSKVVDTTKGAASSTRSDD